MERFQHPSSRSYRNIERETRAQTITIMTTIGENFPEFS